MLHNKRRFHITPLNAPEELADKLANYVWTLCTGFELEHDGTTYLFLNDAFSEDGAQEYAVFRKQGSEWLQVESLTANWCTYSTLLDYTQRILGGEQVQTGVYSLALDYDNHHCRLCA